MYFNLLGLLNVLFNSESTTTSEESTSLRVEHQISITGLTKHSETNP